MNYTKKVMDTVTNAFAEYQKIDAELERAKARLDAEELGAKGYADLVASLNLSRAQVRTEAQRALAEIKTEYQEVMEASMEVDASMLHDDAKLLHLPGLELTTRQFSALVNKHKDNPLMMQLLGSYQSEHPGLYADHVPSPQNRLSDFDSFVGAGVRALENPNGLQAGFFLDGYYAPQAEESTPTEI